MFYQAVKLEAYCRVGQAVPGSLTAIRWLLEKFQAIDRSQRKPLKLRVYQLCAVELMKKLAKKKLDYRGGLW